MPGFCAVKNCFNKKWSTKENHAILYHQFPKDKERFDKWTKFCGRGEKWTPQENQGICSDHFAAGCYDERYQRRRQLFPNAVPGLVQPPDVEQSGSTLAKAPWGVVNPSPLAVRNPNVDSAHAPPTSALTDSVNSPCAEIVSMPPHHFLPASIVHQSVSDRRRSLRDAIPNPVRPITATHVGSISAERPYVIFSSPVAVRNVSVDSVRSPLAATTVALQDFGNHHSPDDVCNLSVGSVRYPQIPSPRQIPTNSFALPNSGNDHSTGAVSVTPLHEPRYSLPASTVYQPTSVPIRRCSSCQQEIADVFDLFSQPAFEETLDDSAISVDSTVSESSEVIELKKQLNEANEHIAKLKVANQAIAIQYEAEGKSLRKRLYILERKVRVCEEKHKSQDDMVQLMRDSLKGVLTENQLDVILGRKTKPRWTSDEISVAFALSFQCRRSYLYLRNELKYPLPGLSTLASYASRLDLRHGHLVDVLRAMKTAGSEMPERDRACVISFDEMSVRRLMEYDVSADEIVGPHSHVQVIMVRGLFAKWKQTIYIAFDQRVTKEILADTIIALHEATYNVVAVTSDNGAQNVGLRSSLNISLTKTSFPHPCTGEDIFFFGDAPHNLKLLRNWFVDGKLFWGDERISPKLIRKLIEERASCELTPLFGINLSHVELSTVEKQNVAKAAKLLSHTTATVLQRRFDGTEHQVEAEKLSQFIAICNDWFDVFNAYSPGASIAQKRSYQGTEEQIKILDRMKQLMLECRGVKKGGLKNESLAIFQKSILLSIESLKGLFSAMGKKYGIEFISTYKLNQDLLENLFSQIRTNGGLYDRPTPLSVIHRIRLIILGKTVGTTQRNVNTLISKEVESDEYLTATVFKKANIVPQIPEDFRDEDVVFSAVEAPLSELPHADDEVSQLMRPEAWPTDILVTDQERDGFCYVLGWVAFKLKKTHPDLGAPTAVASDHVPEYLAKLSYGGLTAPSPEFQIMGASMESVFISWHGACGFKSQKNVIQSVVNEIKRLYPTFDEVVVQRYIKIRTIARMRHINFHILGTLKSATGNQKYAPSKRNMDKDVNSVIKKYKKLNSQ